MSLATVTLDDKYSLDSGRVYLTGTQALVRLPMLQRQRDAAMGLNTACFISGYRGSPLGGFDQQLWQARTFLQNNHIQFQPGVNEDLAATAIWGSQQVGLWPGAKYDGVFAIWYGKGPGVDRSGDVLKHANAAGTAPNGGVLAIAGDDHVCKSSTLPHQSEYALMDAQIPVLNPANIQDILDLGLFGWAMSRFSGCWVGFKTVAEIMDSSASVQIDPHRVAIQLPDDFRPPADGLHLRWPDQPLEQELRLQRYKLNAVRAFARANRIDRLIIDSPRPRFGIATTGKAYLDVRQALDELGIDEQLATEIGLRLYKVAMSWPLEPTGAAAFARGLDEVLVVEEKRPLVETQLKEQLYNLPDGQRPRVIGKVDETGQSLQPVSGELDPVQVARVIAARIARFHPHEGLQQRLQQLEAREQKRNRPALELVRQPHFCAGCPHNSSTRVPDGSRALAGIGCHFMALWMDRHTETFTQMGGEGAPWIGQAPFTETRHVFANIGDGTYFHSGLLAIRAAVAAGVNVTYKILYNDAVAMTGGQPVDGQLSVGQISQQVRAEGVQRIAVVTDEPAKYDHHAGFASATTVHHRDDLERLQRQLREVSGVSVLIYDQTCAAEKRRRRKRGKLADPPQRVFINQEVCEGCGDCGTQSNCLAVVPVETAFGRKRAIDQSSCNKDFSCLNGFCPSFVTVHGGQPRRHSALAPAQRPELPDPKVPVIHQPYDILITGIGGTGVVTIGALLGMAAHLEGKGVTVLDMTGLSQKYGAVVSHLRLAPRQRDLHAVRIAAGHARLLLGCDLLVAAASDTLARLDPQRSAAVVNSHETMPGEFTRNPDLAFPQQSGRSAISAAAASADFLDATRIATRLLGDSIAANLFMVGYAWQQGLIPLSAAAIERAIELNGVAVDFNRQAFYWGRYAAHDRAGIEQMVADTSDHQDTAPVSLEDVVTHRAEHLTRYQNTAYADRYQALVRRVGAAEQARAPGRDGLARAVAVSYAKLLAYKDEYEVARLYCDSRFQARLDDQFEGEYRLEFHLAPPLLARRDPVTGQPRKRRYGPWMLRVFQLLARLRPLRGTPLDPFGYSAERRMERQLIGDYERLVETLISNLNQDNHAIAVELAELAQTVRGYGHIKATAVAAAKARERELLTLFHTPPVAAQAA